MNFRKGTIMTHKGPNFPGWNKAGKDAWMKLDDENWGWWVSLDSTYLVETKEKVWVEKATKQGKHTEKTVEGKWEEVTVYTAHPESEKPLYKKDGSLNRYTFRQTDEGVFEKYESLMDFHQV